MTNQTQPTKSVTFNRENRDYDVFVNGQYRGSYGSYLEADTVANNLVRSILETNTATTQTAVPAIDVKRINRDAIGAAVQELRSILETAIDEANDAGEHKKASNKQSWLNALNKAFLELSVGNWCVGDDVLSIKSRTGRTRYRVTGVSASSCQCVAARDFGRPCWHRAAYRLLSFATHGAKSA